MVLLLILEPRVCPAQQGTPHAEYIVASVAYFEQAVGERVGDILGAAVEHSGQLLPLRPRSAFCVLPQEQSAATREQLPEKALALLNIWCQFVTLAVFHAEISVLKPELYANVLCNVVIWAVFQRPMGWLKA